MVALTPSNEIRLVRVYDAPVQMVWDAWTDPDQVGKWWGPRGFTITTHSKDLRSGGHWDYTMHGPDGTDWPNTTVYHEVVPGSKLVYDHGGSKDRPPLFHVTVLFHDLGNRTRMEMTMALESPEAAAEIKKFIKQASGESTWDRLAEFLEKGQSGKEKFVINRAFDAPQSLVFQMWTDPKHFSKWLPPTGFDMTFIRSDLREGGTAFYSMSGSGFTMYGRAKYLEIKSPDRIVYTQQFCDEHENISRHPKLSTWPETMLTTVCLAQESPDRTRVTVTWEPYGNVTAEELAAFVNHRTSMTQGWTGSFDKLEDLL